MNASGQQPRRILLTGATGYIGRNIIPDLLDQNYLIRAVIRQKNEDLPSQVEQVVVGDMRNITDWSEIVENIDIIIHLAAAKQQTKHLNSEARKELISLNVDCSLNMAKAAISANVSRLIFLSSIKVNGEKSNKALTEKDSPNPDDHYAWSKYTAETSLAQLVSASNLELVIIRPPLIYGQDVSGNFEKLVKLTKRKIPLPLASIKNIRTLCSIENLVDFIITSIKHPSAANETFLVADKESLSTAELIGLIRKNLGQKKLLFPFPVWIIRATAKLLGQQSIASRLLDDLEVDTKKAHDLLGWQPPLSVEKSINRALSLKS